MRKLISILPLVVLLFCGVAEGRADTCNGFSQNLVSNCSFETGSFTGWSGTALTDANSGVDNLAPYVGTYEAYLGSIDMTDTLTQTLATTVGQQYMIEFELMNDTSASLGYTNSFALLFGGSTPFSESAVNAGAYTLYSFLATATSASTNLSFSARNDAGYFDLDSVSVVSTAAAVTPEPSSLMLLGTSVLGAIGMVRRKRFAQVVCPEAIQ